MVLFSALAAMVYGQAAPPTAAPAVTTDGATASAAAKTPVEFVIADIHKSPPSRYAFFQGGFLENGRYILRNATMVDLIRTAYGLKNGNDVAGGPSWLEWNRWDVIGKVPPGTTEAQANEMLKSLLNERFKLVVHQGVSQMPAYWLTVASGGVKMKTAANSTGDAACKDSPLPRPGGDPFITVSCTNETMAALAIKLKQFPSGMYLDNPVVDKTGLKGGYDIDLKFTPMWMLAHANGAGVTIFSALEQQLGLKLELKTAPEQGLVVDSVDQTPTPNAPNLARILPPMPPAQFEVAVIKPSAPDERPMGRIAGDEINVHALPLKMLINLAWGLDPNDKSEIVGAPKWLDADRIDVQAKAAAANLATGAGRGQPSISFDDLRAMLKQLLIERFEMKVHMEDEPADAYELLAVNPKLTPANPTERTLCKEGPGPDGKDPRFTQPILNELLTCQNVTMAQAAEEFPNFANYYLYYPPVDKTGLKGGWDFTLSWSSGDNMPDFNGGGGPPGSPPDANKASEPNGALSFYDAVSKELGLKLVKVKRPEPVLVIDHMDEQPTPN